MMQAYEVVLIYNPQFDETAMNGELDFFEQTVKGLGGHVVSRGIPEKRELGYKVKKNKQGWVVITAYELDRSSSHKLSELLRLRDTIAKFTILQRKAKVLSA